MLKQKKKYLNFFFGDFVEHAIFVLLEKRICFLLLPLIFNLQKKIERKNGRRIIFVYSAH